MKTLQEFTSLGLAQQYEHKTYRKIGGNEASQILSLNGSLDAIENAQQDSTVVEVITGVPTTVGALCRTVVRTIQNGQFATDPKQKDGELNRAATQALVDSGVISQAQADGFYATCETVSRPYESKTEYDFQLAKGTITKVPAQLSALGDSVVMTTTVDCPRHSPRITDSNGVIVDYLRNVSVAGIYVTTIKPEHRGKDLYVDDCYGVIA